LLDEKKPGGNRASLLNLPTLRKMDNKTVPQSTVNHRQIVIEAILNSRNGLTIREIQASHISSRRVRQDALREAAQELVKEGRLDHEEPCRGPGVFFFPYQSPRARVVIVAAEKCASKRAPQKNTWLSSLVVQA
jgi:hypothetical protein